MDQIFIRADSTSQIGAGHLMRCLALAQAWQDQGGKATFISHCESESLRKRLIEEGMDFIAIEKPHPDPSDLDRTIEILSGFSNRDSRETTWLVLDGYHFDADYQKQIKDEGYKLLWIDDYGQADHYYADLVLNQNISADESLYSYREPYTRLLLGTRYVLLRREFKKWQGWQREIAVIARKVLVTLGGADPDNVTLKVIRALKQIDVSELEVKVVVGPANLNREILKAEVSSDRNFQLLENVADMPELMAWADIAVSAGGSTCWEMAFMGLPVMVIVLSENQEGIAKGLNERKVASSLGWYKDFSIKKVADALADFLEDLGLRCHMSQQGRDVVDGLGSDRIEEFLVNQFNSKLASN